MDDRRTMKSGLPRELAEELQRLVPLLMSASVPGARYRLERVLGRGGLFVTFRATRIDESGAVPHVVKVLRPSLLRMWPSGARLLSREQARVLSLMNERVPPSPHVVRLLEIGELAADPERGIDVPAPWLALERIEEDPGPPSLLSRVRAAVTETGASLDPISAARVLEGVARGLDWVHQHGLLHRGLTPSNVLCTGVERALLARVSDVAIARPAGLPPTFGFAPPIAPEQRDPSAALTPACDLYAFAGVARFTIAGAMGAGAMDEGPLADAPALHPAFSERSARAALGAIERVLTLARAEDPEQRPPTAHSLWEALAPPLLEIAARFRPPSRGHSAPSRAPRVLTERHRPEAARALERIAVDREGHALSISHAGSGPAIAAGELLYFDGQKHRRVVAPLADLDCVATIGCGAFLVGGRTATGAARLFRLDADGARALPLDRSGRVVAAALADDTWIAVLDAHDELHVVDLQGSTPLPAMQRVLGVAPLGDGAWAIAGGGATTFLATFDARTRSLRPHSLPLRRPAVSLAAGGDAVILGAHDGALITLRWLDDARRRLHTTREQLPSSLPVSAVTHGTDGTIHCAVGPEVLVREGPDVFRTVFREAADAPTVALAARTTSVLAFLADGRVLESRALGE